MYQFVLRRAVLSIPTLIIVSFLIFGMIRLNPDSVVAARLGEGYTPEQAELIKDEYGLNNPIATEYVAWLGRVVRGDWGDQPSAAQAATFDGSGETYRGRIVTSSYRERLGTAARDAEAAGGGRAVGRVGVRV